MKSRERQKYILNTARDFGFVSISDAAKHLGTSIETVRRDINKLVELNYLMKKRGGAAPTKLSLRRDADYLERINTHKKERMSIGSVAASMIKSGSVVALDSGVSIQEVASAIRDVTDVTFVTNSLPTAAILLRKIDFREITGRVIMLGGEFDVSNKFTKGARLAEDISKYYFDIAFISCTSLSEDGASSFGLDECYYEEQLIKRSTVSVLVADSEKIGKNSLYTFASLSEFNHIIVDNKYKMPSNIKKVINETACELIVTSINDLDIGR